MKPTRDIIDLREVFALLKAGQVIQAETIALKAASANKKNPLVFALLGQIAETRGKLDEAAGHYRKSINFDGRQAMTHVALGQVRTSQGRFKEAISCHQKALKLHPDLPNAIAALADAFEKQGDHEQAQAVIEPLLKADKPLSPQLAVVRATILMNTRDHEQAADFAASQIARADVDADNRILLGYVLGQSLETLQRYEESMAAYEQANLAKPGQFDAAGFKREIDELIQTFSSIRLSTLAKANKASELPIFIVGMPRSGTTLIERIIDAHPQARGAGEIIFLHDIIHTLQEQIQSDLPYPRCVLDLVHEDTDHLGEQYLEKLRPFSRGVKRVTDKYLQNWHYLGLISILLPGAKVIHCQRDPRDTCFSCFASSLSRQTNPWSSDLESIAFVYRQYERLMAHWKATLEIPMLEVRYEDLIADSPAQSRRLIEFIGLPWNEACLNFQDDQDSKKAAGIAPTLSYDQVRRPLYTSSIGRAMRFPGCIELLNRALSDSGS